MYWPAKQNRKRVFFLTALDDNMAEVAIGDDRHRVSVLMCLTAFGGSFRIL